jgi:leucyl aminopeptidase (aminopeptidase T)
MGEVAIGRYATRAEAEIVTGLLESEGISASIAADDAGGAYPFVLSGGAEVLVDDSDADAAREALARAGNMPPTLFPPPNGAA